MSGTYGEIAWGIVTTFLAFLLGLAWQRLVQLVVNFRARRFWRPLVENDLNVVLGRLHLPQFEASGVIGAGDNIALQELSEHLHRIGFKRFTRSYHDEPGWHSSPENTALAGNLILLGGPDANSLTRLVLDRVRLGIEFKEVTPAHLLAVQDGSAGIDDPPAEPRRRSWPRAQPLPAWLVPVIVDSATRTVYGPVVQDGTVRTDCGIMIRCPNPFNPAREVMIFCGSYGFGTWAAARFAVSDDFLRRLPPGVRFVECVLGVDIVHHTPHLSTVELLRPLPAGDPAPP